MLLFGVGVKCNKFQFIFQYFNYRLIKQVALLKSVPHLKFVKLNLAKTSYLDFLSISCKLQVVYTLL